MSSLIASNKQLDGEHKQAFIQVLCVLSSEPNKADAVIHRQSRGMKPQVILVRCMPANKTMGTAAHPSGSGAFIHTSTLLRCAAPGLMTRCF